MKINANDQKNILLVEDDYTTAELTSKIIKNFGYNVFTADSGEKAFEIAVSDEKIDLILMDIDLGSGIDGAEAARRILEKRNIPIVFLTSHTDSEIVKKTENIASYGYVVKNSGNFVLQTSIRMAFELFKSHAEIQKELSEHKQTRDGLKQADAALKKSLNLLAETEKIGKVGGWEFNIDTGKQTWTNGVYYIHELDTSYDPTVEKGINFYTPASKPIIEQAVRQAILRNEPFDVELEIVTSKGNLRSVHAIGKTDPENKKVYGFFQDITDRKKTEEKIRALLAEKELLLKEIHHRVKNNLNTVAGLLEMQIDALKEPAAVDALKDARNRVLSMMLMYNKLYHSENFNDLPLKEYLSPLVDEIIGIFPNNTIVKVEKNIADFIIDSKKLSDLGIIVNEVLTNTMKYAFKGRSEGLITISAIHSGNHATITISDNGIGMPESFDISASDGFGLQLVYMLAQLIHAEIKIERDNGTKFTMELDL